MRPTAPTRSREPASAFHLVTAFAIAALFTAVPARSVWAQSAPSLETAGSFAVLAGSTVTNTGPTTVFGDLGVSPGTAVTGFPPGIIVPPGELHAADAVASLAQIDVANAYHDLASRPCTRTFLPTDDLGGRTLVAGVYCFASSAQLTGTLTLDAGGNADALFIFKIGSTLTTSSGASVKLIRGAQACNVFWQVGSSATLGSTTSFIGNILALTSISLTTGTTLHGRALAQNGAVTLDSNQIFFSQCQARPCVDTTRPTVAVTGMNPGVDGRTEVYLTVQDTGCGLASIIPIVATNTTIVIPPFVPGTTGAVIVTATKITPGSKSVVGLRVTDINGNVTIYDPVDFVLTAEDSVTVTVPDAEHFVTVINNGLYAISISNGLRRNSRTIWLHPGATRTVNIRGLIRRGDNSLTFEATGPGSAVVLVHPR